MSTGGTTGNREWKQATKGELKAELNDVVNLYKNVLESTSSSLDFTDYNISISATTKDLTNKF